jgi:WD40 repeat protein
MRTIFWISFSWILASQALAAPVAVIPNGGAGVGSLSVINPATGTVERSLVTAVAATGSEITNASFAITNTGDSAAVLGLQQNSASAVYILSVVNLSTGRITEQRELSFPGRRGPVLLAANPKASVLYLGYVDSSANFHIQAIDPTTLDVVLESNLGAHGGLSMIVSPDGKTIYLNGSPYAAVAAVQASTLKLIGTVLLADSSYAAVSPDSSTLYVAAGKYPDMAVTIIDTAALQVTQTVPLASLSVIFGLAISPDGSQLYLPAQANFQGEDIFTLDLATQALMAVAAVVTGNIAVAPDGTVYVGNGSEVLVFDPAAQSVTGTLEAFSDGSLALNATGSRLYFLNAYSSTLAATGPPPQQNILGMAATGSFSSAAYDATNNLLLVADTANNLEVLDALSFQPAGQLFIPNLNAAYAYLTADGGSGFAASGAQVWRFDPVSLKVTGAVTLLNNPNDDLISNSQPVMNGSTLYVPLSASQNGGPVRFAGSAGASSTGVPNSAIAVVDALNMKLVALWPFQALPTLGLAPGHGVAYAVVPAGSILDLDEIDLTTGKVTLQVQVPGEGGSAYSNPAVSPDGSTIYFSSDNTLYTFDAQTLGVTNTVTGIGLTSLTVSPDGNYLYGGTPVPCEPCSEQIVSTSSLKVVGTIPVSTAYPVPALFVGN